MLSISVNRLKYGLSFIVFTLAYFAAAHLGGTITSAGLSAMPVWPPSGIALAWLLLTGDLRYTYAVFAGSLLFNLSMSIAPPLAILIALGNALEVVVGTKLLMQIRGFDIRLNRVSSAFALIIIGALVSTTISAATGTFGLWFFHKNEFNNPFLTFQSWWVGDATGILIITPVLLALRSTRIHFHWRSFAEAALLGASLFGISVVAFGNFVRLPDHFVIAYTIFPLLIWATLRFEQLGSSIFTLIIWLMFVPAIMSGRGPFLASPLFQNLLFFQSFLGVVSATGLMMAALVTERRESGEELRAARDELADKVTHLRQSRDQLDFILHGISDGIAVTDPQGHFIYVNEAMLKAVGAPLDYRPQTSKELFDKLRVRNESGTPLVYGDIPSQIALRGQPSTDSLIRIRTVDNSEERWLMIKSAPVMDKTGRVRLAVSIVKDLTERKRAEESMEFLDHVSRMIKSSVDYEYTLSQLAHLAIRNMADWCHIDLLEEGRKLRAVAVASNRGENSDLMDEIFRHRSEIPLPGSATAKALRTGESVVITDFNESVFRSAFLDQESIDKLTVLNLKSGLVIPLIAREKILGVMTLVSQSRKYGSAEMAIAEELARRAGIAVDNASLYRDAQKAIQVRDEFLSVASHELKTPITAMKLQMQLRKRSLAKFGTEFFSSDKIKQIADEDEKQMDRLVRLVDDMLDISRLQSGRLSLRKELVDLGELVKEVVPRFQAQLQNAGNQIQIVVRGNVTGYWDRTRIEQMFINLLTNAIKYGCQKPICIAIRAEGQKVSLSVIDNGVGIAPEDQDRIFKQFERAGNLSVASGLGLGLYIAQKIAQAHGGLIRVESHLGSGSIFTIELPGASSAAPQLSLA